MRAPQQRGLAACVHKVSERQIVEIMKEGTIRGINFIKPKAGQIPLDRSILPAEIHLNILHCLQMRFQVCSFPDCPLKFPSIQYIKSADIKNCRRLLNFDHRLEIFYAVQLLAENLSIFTDGSVFCKFKTTQQI